MPTSRKTSLRRLAAAGVILGMVAALVLTPAARVARADITAQQVRESIDRGVAYLLREQQPSGGWNDPAGYPGGITALCTLALLNCGVPTSDPHIQSALNYMRKIPPTVTYAAALQTMVFAAAEPTTNLPLIRRNADWLERNQKQEGSYTGAWGYPMAEGDNSNSQFALLALHEAERVGVSVKDRTWKRAYAYWSENQLSNGGWGYKPNHAASGSMTCAGIAAMVIASDRLNLGDAQADGDRVRCCGQQEDNARIERALAWLGRNFSVEINPASNGIHGWHLYYLYGLERAGRLTNRRLIGDHDWYREGAEKLIQQQDNLSGYWTGNGHAEDNPHVATSFSLLFLAKGRRPVLCAKIKHEPAHDWNHHRSDLAHLTSYVETHWQRELTWQIIDAANATTEDLLEAPVIYISGSERPEFTADQVGRLRAYVNRGGFIFAEACCEGDEFDAGFKELMRRVFPEKEYQLRDLPFDHPAYTAEERVDPEAFPLNTFLKGIDIGCRTSVIYAPHEFRLSCFWELARPGREKSFTPKVRAQIQAARSLGINILAYATNREVKFKLDLPPDTGPSGTADPIARAKLYIGKIRHSGGWNAAPGALMSLLRVTAHETGMRVDTDQHEVTLSDPLLMNYPIVFIHGRNAFRLSDTERKQLKLYVERGGVLMGDAICGSDSFVKAFRREMRETFGQDMQTVPAGHPMYTSQFGGFDLKTVRRRAVERRGDNGPLKAAVDEVEPELEGIKLGDRYGVIFSPYDISCALEKHESLECPGYVREDAARIGLNIVLYAQQQ
jgi:hypothetical protein